MPHRKTNCPFVQTTRPRSGHGGILASQRGGVSGSRDRVLRMPLNNRQYQLKTKLVEFGVKDHLASGMVRNYPARLIIEAVACSFVSGARAPAGYVVSCIFGEWPDLPALRRMDIDYALRLLGLYEEAWAQDLFKYRKEDEA